MAHLGTAQSTMSQHLACLRDCGLATSRPQGRASLFSLAVQGELLDLLGAAERLLAATGRRRDVVHLHRRGPVAMTVHRVSEINDIRPEGRC